MEELRGSKVQKGDEAMPRPKLAKSDAGFWMSLLDHRVDDFKAVTNKYKNWRPKTNQEAQEVFYEVNEELWKLLVDFHSTLHFGRRFALSCRAEPIKKRKYRRRADKGKPAVKA